jgi:hypothetical protein
MTGCKVCKAHLPPGPALPPPVDAPWAAHVRYLLRSIGALAENGLQVLGTEPGRTFALHSLYIDAVNTSARAGTRRYLDATWG